MNNRQEPLQSSDFEKAARMIKALKDITYVCLHCPGKEFTSNGFKDHNKQVHRSQLVACKRCRNMFKTAADVSTHNCPFGDDKPRHQRKVAWRIERKGQR